MMTAPSKKRATMDPIRLEEPYVDKILKVLQAHPEGASRPVLQELAGLGELDPQIIRRLLVRMAGAGWVRPGGLTRDRRYFWTDPGAVAPASENYPPLGPEGRKGREWLSQPLSLRKPVTYQRAFLDAYRPEVTAYLSESARGHLASLGKSREPNRPAGTYARQIFQRLLIDLSWNSARLEGNTYSLLDTEKLITLGESAEGKDLLETQMILNHIAAIEFMVESAGEIAPDPSTVQNLHALLAENLLSNPMDGGCLRSMAVGIHGTTYVPTAVPQVIEECFRQILRTASEIQDPFEQSFFLLVHLPYLQPFIDGNKRTGRLAANIPFIRENCSPITFMDVPVAAFTDGMLAVYELNDVALLRDIYMFAYERSCARFSAVLASMGEPDPFRLRYRGEIKTIVREVVLTGETFQMAEARIRTFAQVHLPQEAWTRFLVVVETELASLHDGNFARYQVRPSQFQDWRQKTQGSR